MKEFDELQIFVPQDIVELVVDRKVDCEKLVVAAISAIITARIEFHELLESKQMTETEVKNITSGIVAAFGSTLWDLREEAGWTEEDSQKIIDGILKASFETLENLGVVKKK